MIDRVKAENPNMLIVSDQSSTLGSRDHHEENLWENGYDIILSGAHKNFGTAGITFLIMKDEVVDKIMSQPDSTAFPLPKTMDWKNFVRAG